MQMTITSVDELVEILSVVKDTVADNSAQFPGTKYSFQFSLQSAPTSNALDSTIFSKIEELAGALRKFQGDARIGWLVAVEATSEANRVLSETTNARLEAKQSLKQQLAGDAGKIATLGK